MNNTKLVIVEDENIVALDIQHRLEKLGYQVLAIVSNGSEAVKTVINLKPDLVLMDIKLPGEIDGIKAAELIQAKYNVPIVYITAYTEETTLKRAKITEPFGYILKPFEERELRINIEIALARHSMQKALRERELLFKRTLERIDDAVLTTNAEMRLQFMNPAAELFCGINFSEAKDKLIFDILKLKNLMNDKVFDLFKYQKERQKSLLKLESLRGEIRIVQATFVSISPYDNKMLGYVIVLHDFTEREKAEKALRVSEERYREFFEDNLAGDCITLADGQIIACNTSFANMLGFKDPSEVIKYKIASFFPNFQKDGSFLQALKEYHKLKNYKIVFKNRAGQELFIIANIIGEFNANNELEEIKWYIIDNTESIRMQEQFLHSQKMEGIGRLAGGLAHDFNNLLGAIIGYADLILETLPVTEPLYTDIDAIRKAGRKAASLTRQLLAFSRRQVLQPKVININNLILDLEKMLRRLLPENISLITILEEDLWRVNIDPMQIEQVLVNLAVNARDAMPEGGRLLINTLNVEVTEELREKHFGILPGFYVLIKVADNGLGIPDEIKQRIFEPFFTTKELGKGTGLGLSTAYGIIKQSKGHIFFESIKEKGSTFFVYLPRVLAEEEKAAENQSIIVPKKGSETILLVEDEEIFRTMVAKSLEGYGYNILEASNPGEAILICEQFNSRLDLLITDVIMPHLSGIKLAERLQSIRPGLKVLFISGYFDDSFTSTPSLPKGTFFLHKPFSPQELNEVVRKIFDEKGEDN